MKEKHKKLKPRYKNIIMLILFFIFLATFIFSLCKIINWRENNKANKKINEITHEYINTDNNEKFNIDFNKLKELNSDTVAYLKVNNTNIDYVVVQANDNAYYLEHNFEKKNNKSGWIFMDYNNALDGSDKNIVIYGHNTIDKSMFGSLKYTIEPDWYKNKDNYIVILATPDGINKYQVFSTYKVDNEEYYITTSFKDDNDFSKFLKTIKKRSKFDYGVELDTSDQILTLSTCANNGKKRVVLHAKKIVE